MRVKNSFSSKVFSTSGRSVTMRTRFSVPESLFCRPSIAAAIVVALREFRPSISTR